LARNAAFSASSAATRAINSSTRASSVRISASFSAEERKARSGGGIALSPHDPSASLSSHHEFHA
jgi:hypothetical protein